MDFKKKRAKYVWFFHLTAELLEKVRESLEMGEEGFTGAECQLRMAEHAFSETLLWGEKQKPYPKKSGIGRVDRRDIADLKGHLEGAQATIREMSKN